MKTISSIRLATSHLTAAEEALIRCEKALELKDQGSFEGSQKAMHPLWQGVGERPEIDGLPPEIAAEVLLTAGVLTGWIGSRSDRKKAQEAAKNLITESISLYEAVSDVKKIATARAEIATCYWREGELHEARIMLLAALQQLPEGNTRARSLLKLTAFEVSASQYNAALNVLDDNRSLFDAITNHAIKGSYHNEKALVLRHLAQSEPSKRMELLQKALTEFEQADHHFGLAKNIPFRANVKNNVGLVLFNLSRCKEAHKYLLEARRLALSLRDKVKAAHIDETRAQVFIAENNHAEAETVARQAIDVLEKSGQQGAVAESLITHGIALARLNQGERARFIFERSIEVATKLGASNIAGLAALTMIEELDDLPRATLQSSFEQASEGLAKSLNQDLTRRFNAAANKVYAALADDGPGEDAAEAVLTPCNFQKEVLKFEGTLIRRALSQANGSVTRAASLLSMSYQALAYIIGGRHKDLLKERSPVRRRRSQKREMQDSRLQ